jgi:multidrug efflux pump subunit AcrA (membrane-fusion protein)
MVAAFGLLVHVASAQTPYQTSAGEMLLFESNAADRVVEKVRAAVPGVMVEIYVKPGDPVKKGQLLGHTELDAAKLQVDLAKSALDNKANVDSAEGQAEAWTIAREETEDLVRDRKAEKSRLDWANAMEKMYIANYEGQLEAENVQKIQYQYAKEQYEKRYFRAPVDGVVSEVLVDVGKSVNFATHAFTISNESAIYVPVRVPAPIADYISPQTDIPIRTSDGKAVNHALVDSVIDDPLSVGQKIIKLLVKASDFPATTRAKLKGMKFDVLLPSTATQAAR